MRAMCLNNKRGTSISRTGKCASTTFTCTSQSPSCGIYMCWLKRTCSARFLRASGGFTYYWLHEALDSRLTCDNSHTRHMVVIASVQYSEALLLIRSDPNLLFSVVAIWSCRQIVITKYFTFCSPIKYYRSKSTMIKLNQIMIPFFSEVVCKKWC